MPRLKDAITGLVERLSGPYKGMPYLRYFKTEAEKKAYLDFYNKAKSGTADAPRSRRVSEGVYAEVQRSRGPDVGTTYNRFFKTEAERDVYLKRIQERASNTVQAQGTKTTAIETEELMKKASEVNTPIGPGTVKASIEGEARRKAQDELYKLKLSQREASRSIPNPRKR